MIRQSYFWVYISKRTESKVSKRYFHTHIHRIIHSSQEMKAPECLSIDECGIYIKWNIIQL